MSDCRSLAIRKQLFVKIEEDTWIEPLELIADAVAQSTVESHRLIPAAAERLFETTLLLRQKLVATGRHFGDRVAFVTKGDDVARVADAESGGKRILRHFRLGKDAKQLGMNRTPVDVKHQPRAVGSGESDTHQTSNSRLRTRRTNGDTS